MNRQAYTSTVVAPVQIVAGVVSVAVVAALLAVGGAAVWLIVVAALVIAAATAHLAVVRLGVNDERIIIGQGVLPLPARTIAATSVVEASRAELTRAQTFGIGVPWHWRTNRLTVRPGPTLHLRTTDGERLSISTPDPDAVLRLLAAAKETS